MLLYMDDRFADHHTGPHPECAERIVRINQHLRSSQFIDRCKLQVWKPAAIEQVTRVHDADYLNQLQRIVANGGGRVESDTVASVQTLSVAMLAAGAAVDAVGQVLDGHDARAACLVRPPGHHALQAAPMGFCFLNNIAIAARHAVTAYGLDRVLIVDFDVHHGNGTQDTFWTDPSVCFYSMHRWPFYPGSGSKDEIGSGRGLGTTHNEPVEHGTPATTVIKQFESSLARFAQQTQPQLVLISAGFDAHRLDPIGSLDLETEHFTQLTQTLVQIAETYAQGRMVSLLEGGYNLDILPEAVEAHLSSMLGVQ